MQIGRGTRMGRGLLGIAFTCALIVIVRSPPAFATHPGVNGRIAYTDLIDKGTLGATRRAVFTSPGGQLTHPTHWSVVNGNSTTYYADNDWDPAWSPDGKTLAFARRHGQTNEFGIYTVSADGSNLHLVAGHLDGNGNPTFLKSKFITNLVWSPDGLRIGFLAQQTNGARQIASVLAASGPVPQFSGLVSSFFSATAINGFDWTRAGIVYDCRNFNGPPWFLFCVHDASNGQLIGASALGPESGPMSTGSIVVGGSEMPTQWRPTGSNTRNVMFVLGYASDPSNSNATYRSEVFSLNSSVAGSANNLIGSGLVRHVTNDDVVSCTNKVNGVSTTTYQRRYLYASAAPSPDGRFFVARRSETETTTSPSGTCSFRTVNAGLYVFRNGGGMQSTVVVSPDAAEAAWQPDPATLAVKVSDGHGRPLDDLKVELRELDSEALVPITAERKAGGTYTFADVPPGPYRIRAYLTDEVGHAFEIRHGWPSVTPVEVDRQITIAADAIQVEADFPISEDGPILSSNVGTAEWGRLDDLAAIYFETRRFVVWIREHLTPNTGPSVVPIYAFVLLAPDGPMDRERAFHAISEDAIYLGAGISEYSRRDDPGDEAPENGEWHEFAHHLQHRFALPGSLFACPDYASLENHAGWLNHSTCDSFVEGFAMFLATLAGSDAEYASFGSLERHTKAWETRLVGSTETTLGSTTTSAEDLAVATLLWDLVDSEIDSESAIATYLGSLPRFVEYRDGVQLSLPQIWQTMTTSQPKTVAALQDALSTLPGMTTLTVDLDGDGVKDVSTLDPAFLMHGFHPVISILQGAPPSNVFRYDYEAARSQGLPANARVGLSSHYLTSGTSTTALDPRLNLRAGPTSNVAIDVQDATGRALAGATLRLVVATPSSTTELVRPLATGDGDLVHLELPPYFEGFLPADAPIPPCDAAATAAVTVTATATLNGASSIDSATFDGCSYWQAILLSTSPAPLALTLHFPDDDLPPVTTATRRSLGQVFGDYTVGTWSVDLTCADPATSGFASGCARTEYSLDGAPFALYTEPIEVTSVGLHPLEYRSIDAAGHVESSQHLSLGVVAVRETVAPVTTVSSVASPPAVGETTTGTWTVTLSCTDSGGSEPTAGCLRTEYGVDGAPLSTYAGAIVLSVPGVHVIRYRSLDVLQNAEAIRALQLIVAGPDTRPPWTEVAVTANGVQSPFEPKVMGSFSVSLDGCFDYGPMDQVVSGCDRTEWALDGGAFAPFTSPVVLADVGVHSFAYRSIDLAGNFESTQTLDLEIVAATDGDGDGLLDFADNCSGLVNPDQLDTDFDGYGNRCDPDFNNNGVVDSNDGSRLKALLGSPAFDAPDLDLDGDGLIDAADMDLLKASFRHTPGPAYGYEYFGFPD